MTEVEAYLIEALRDYEPDRIVVFGSHARGGAGPDSDVDVLVVKNDPRRPVERIRDVQAMLYRRDRRERWRAMPAFDVLVWTPDEIRERVALGDPFFRSVVSTGRTILEREPDAA
jgi:predicted nucleotidyltransferase